MDQLFKFHKLNETGIRKAQEIADLYDTLLNRITDFVPTGRELSIVKTKLEEACFFTKKGMAVQTENREPGFQG